MTSQMTERFSAPGATLVKLFGRPAEEAKEFGRRAARVSDIGVRSAMAMEVFFRALTLVSGLAQALIYGLGGYLALQGDLDAGHRRHPGPAAHPPLRAAHRAGHRPARRRHRAGQLRAGLRGARHRAAHRRAAPIRKPCRTGRCRSSSTTSASGYPSADQVSLASLEEVAVLDDRVGDEVLHGVAVHGRAGPDGRPGRPVGRGQVDAGLAGAAPLRRRRGRGPALGGIDVRDLSFDTIRDTVGVVTQDGHLFHDTHPGQPALRRARMPSTTSCGPPSPTPGSPTLVAVAARRARHRRRRARLPAVGW